MTILVAYDSESDEVRRYRRQVLEDKPVVFCTHEGVLGPHITLTWSEAVEIFRQNPPEEFRAR